MDVQASSATRPRSHQELLAVVDGERLLLASAPLLDLARYSRREAASPEFRAAYLLHPASPMDALTFVGPGPFQALLAGPGSDPTSYWAYVVPVGLPWAPGARAVLLTREGAIPQEVVRDRALRALVGALRSATADRLHRLRKADDDLAALGFAHPDELPTKLAAVLRSHAEHLAAGRDLQGP